MPVASGLGLQPYFKAIFMNSDQQRIKKLFDKDIEHDEKKYANIIKLIYSDKTTKDYMDKITTLITKSYVRKNAEASKIYRTNFVGFPKEPNGKKSLKYINKAILYAPLRGVVEDIDDGYTLALAFYHRGGELLNTGNSEQAVRDLRAAVNNGLFQREYLLEDAFELCKRIGEQSQKPELDPLKKLAKRIFKGCGQDQIYPSITQGVRDLEISPLVNLGASDNAGKERLAVASDEINAGSVLLLEVPVCACLKPEFFHTHCQDCLKRIEYAYPCKICASVAFCSHACMVKATSTYHKYECQYLDYFKIAGLPPACLLSIRLFTQARDSTEAMRKIHNLENDLNKRPNDLNPHTGYEAALYSMFIVSWLYKSNYFAEDEEFTKNPTQHRLLVSGVIFGLLRILPYNIQTIYETRPDKGYATIGFGLYKLATYFNHDCCPKVIKTFVGRSICLVSVRPIGRGKEITVTYGPTFEKMEKQERQDVLSSHFFINCKCDACTENWPLLEDIGTTVRIKCLTIGCGYAFPAVIAGKTANCPKCKHPIDFRHGLDLVKHAEEMAEKAVILYEMNKIEDAWKAAICSVYTFDKTAALPHRPILETCNLLRTIIRKLLH